MTYEPAGAKATDRVLAVLPSMSVLKADLTFAGIEYGDRIVVETCRQLGDELVKSWHAHGVHVAVPPDEDETL